MFTIFLVINYLVLLRREVWSSLQTPLFFIWLKQSPHSWFGWLSSIVHDFAMVISELGHSFFYKHTSTCVCRWYCSYPEWSRMGHPVKTTPILSFSNQRLWTIKVFPWYWNSSIMWWYRAFTTEVCMKYCGRNLLYWLQGDWFSHGYKFQASLGIGGDWLMLVHIVSWLESLTILHLLGQYLTCNECYYLIPSISKWCSLGCYNLNSETY